MASNDVVGYAYQADIWCADCMKDLARAWARELGDANDYRNSSSEEAVAAWAHQEGRPYPTASSDAPDTNDFPYPILKNTEDADDTCNQHGCGNHLLTGG